jgi:hypothetical protein
VRKIIALLGSLAVGLFMAAAGLVYDAATLTYGGVVLLGFAAVLWLVDWGKGISATPRSSKDDQIFRAAANACYDAGVALGAEDRDMIGMALPKVDSAIASISNRFGIARPALPRDDDREALRRGVDYLTLVSPYLQAGNKHDATAAALGFVRQHGVFSRGG